MKSPKNMGSIRRERPQGAEAIDSRGSWHPSTKAKVSRTTYSWQNIKKSWLRGDETRLENWLGWLVVRDSLGACHFVVDDRTGKPMPFQSMHNVFSRKVAFSYS